MRDYYFNNLKKEEKKKVIQEYKKEYAKSDFQKRLLRLMIYSLVGYAFSIFLVVYSLIVQKDIVANLLIAIPLFIAATIFLIGRHYAKLNVLNTIALKKKKNWFVSFLNAF